MASAWSEEDTFTCSVCLDTLKDPATLPCGHSYCMTCIQSHWDKRDNKGQYNCPQCRQVFNPRPSLAKSTVLVEAMEKLRTNSVKQSSLSDGSSAPPSVPLYLEVLPARGSQRGGGYPPLPSVKPRLCPLHNRPLDLFCHEDRECVCEVCFQHGHKGHRVLKPEDERKERQKELVQMQKDVQKRIQETERRLAELPHVARQHKALVQALEQESTHLFSELVKTVNVTGVQVGEAVSAHESSLGSRLEGQIHSLEQEVAPLRWKSEELSRLADMQDHICFLKNFLTMEPPGPKGSAGESMLSQEEEVVASVRSAMKELQESIQEVCKEGVSKIVTLLNPDPVASKSNTSSSSLSSSSSAAAAAASSAAAAAASSAAAAAAVRTAPKSRTWVTTQDSVTEMRTDSPPLPPPRPQWHNVSPAPPHPEAPPGTAVGHVSPEPKTREELLKFRFEPTMDTNTVYRHVQLSDGGHKATMRAENLNLPDHPERFDYWRQVLCREALAGSPYYWEVEWTGKKVTIGVAYKEMERKGSVDCSRLGHNGLSWSLYWSGAGFSFWHNGQDKPLGSPKARRIGVYLDQHAGILAFYRVTHNQAHLIHQHQCEFSGPLYAGFRFWAGVGATVTVCQLD